MRTLSYRVTHQLISPQDDLKDIYAGTENYLQLEFEFDENWNGCTKAIVFVINSKKEIPKLLRNNKIMVPEELCQSKYIRFYLVGKRTNYRIQTERTTIEVIKYG